MKKSVKIIAIENNVTASDYYLEKIIKAGEDNYSKNRDRIENIIHDTDINDLITIIYTSGTTGNPKGVMLNHRNFLHDISNSLETLNVYKEDIMISVLPIWHIFERTVEYTMIYSGANIYYSSIKGFVNDVKLIKPSMVIVVPRILEAFYDKVQINISKLNLLKKIIFRFFFMTSGIYFDLKSYIKKTIPFYKKSSLFLTLLSLLVSPVFFVFYAVSRLIFKSISDVLGGRTRVIISGGGGLPLKIDRFFNLIGLTIVDGYGMTETSPIICLRDPEHPVLDTCGHSISNIEVIIVKKDGNRALPGEKGELLVKGDLVMQGYFKNDEATGKVIRDGWLHTGDLVVRTYYDEIKILGRIKDTIVLSGGENVEPEKIEAYLNQSDLISNAVVVGQNQKRLKALIVPEKEKVIEFASSKKIEFTNYESLINSDAVYDEIKREIDENVNNNPDFKTFEKIFEFKIIIKPFEIGDELTQSLKIKRHVIYEKYKQIIDGMFNK